MPQFLTDDELLDVPLGNLMPGELARSFKVHASHEHKVEEIEALHVMQHHEQQVAEDAKQEEEEALHHREEALLAQIAERDAELRIEAERLDDRAIKLEDGRRAYVDGDDYRDAEGRKLTGADRAQAEVLHVEKPDATTWQEQRELNERYAELQKMKHNVEDLQAGKAGANEATLLSQYEKQIQPKASTLPDYSNTDYMGALGLKTATAPPKTGPAL